MYKRIKTMAMAGLAFATLLSVTLTASAATPAREMANLTGDAPKPIRERSASTEKVTPSTCKTLQATDVYWVTLTDAGDIDQKMDSYPDGTSKVIAAFDYNCIPKKTKMGIVWSIDGEQALTDSSTPKPTDKADTYTYSLYKKDNSALTNGDYAVEFYLGETLLTTGKVTVGGDISVTDVTTETMNTKKKASAEVTVQGTVVDSKSKKPISGAVVIVLNDGVDPKAWLKNGKDEDILAFAKSDGKGQFALNNPVPVNQPLPWIIGAKGYKVIMQSDFTLQEGTDDPYIMNINLERSK